MPSLLDTDILAAALVGYQAKLKEIEAAMADLRTRIGGKPAPTRAVEPGEVRKPVISPEGLARIVAAQKKRWAAVRKAAAAKAAPAESKPRVKKSARKKTPAKKVRSVVAPAKAATKAKAAAKVAAKKVVRQASATKKTAKTVPARKATPIESTSRPLAEPVPPVQ